MLLTLLLLISFPRVMYVAIQPIQKGSEIVIDYGDEFWKVRETQVRKLKIMNGLAHGAASSLPQ